MKVKIQPQNIELEILPGQSVLDLAAAHGLPLKSLCNGLPSCAECRVKVVDGEANVLPPSSQELNLIGTGYFLDRRRLACQLQCFGDIELDWSEQLRLHEENRERRPQGRPKSKGTNEPSHAVTGNLLDNEDLGEDEALNSISEERPNHRAAPRDKESDTEGEVKVGASGSKRRRRNRSRRS